jgi:hypothetical protein
MKYETNIDDNELKYKTKPEHFILADKFMDYVLLENDITICKEANETMKDIYNYYLCSRIALDDHDKTKHLEYQELWNNKLKELIKLSVRGD